MLWKISVMRIIQDVNREAIIVKSVLETGGYCMTTKRSVGDSRFTALLPQCDRPTSLLCRAGHAPDRVDHQGVPDQFKNVSVTWAVAIGVGAGQIEIHFLSVSEDQLTLATTIGQRRNQCTGIY